jgi:hypothetical protein
MLALSALLIPTRGAAHFQERRALEILVAAHFQERRFHPLNDAQLQLKHIHLLQLRRSWMKEQQMPLAPWLNVGSLLRR